MPDLSDAHSIELAAKTLGETIVYHAAEIADYRGNSEFEVERNGPSGRWRVRSKITLIPEEQEP